MISTPKTCLHQIWGSSIPRPPSCNSPWPVESSRSINHRESFPRPVPEEPPEPVRKSIKEKPTLLPSHAIAPTPRDPHHRHPTLLLFTPDPDPHSSLVHCWPPAPCDDLSLISLTVARATAFIDDFGIRYRCPSIFLACAFPAYICCCSIEHTSTRVQSCICTSID